MFNQCEIPGEPVWRQVIELESRKEVIQGWLSSSVVPIQLVEVLQELLATTERQLQAVRRERIDSTASPTRREAE